MGKLQEINGYVRLLINRLPGIRSELVINDDNWQEWDFPRFVEALRKCTERNPVTQKDDHLNL